MNKVDKASYNNEKYKNYQSLIAEFDLLINVIKKGVGISLIEKQHNKGRLTARERIDALIDDGSVFLEFGKFAAFEMYEDYGGAP
jgi:acetyl-CoA carboxylase carboxyltransferase component